MFGQITFLVKLLQQLILGLFFYCLDVNVFVGVDESKGRAHNQAGVFAFDPSVGSRVAMSNTIVVEVSEGLR